MARSRAAGSSLPGSLGSEVRSILLVPILATLALPTIGSANEELEAAETVLALLVSAKPESAAKLFHYPPSYSLDKRDDDIRGVAASLRVLSSEFGKPTEPTPHAEPATFFGVGVFGGDLNYWQAPSPFSSVTHLYNLQYEKAGSGYLKIEVFTPPHSTRPEVRSVSFGFPTSVASARSTVAAAMAVLVRMTTANTPPNLGELIAAKLDPSSLRGE